MKRAFLILIIFNFLIGCAATPNKRFPDFPQQLSSTPNIDVVINTLVRSDISGTDIGINSQKNAEALELTQNAILEALTLRGIKPNVVFSDIGLTFRPDDKHFYSKDWKSINKPYLGTVVHTSNKQWINKEVQDFFINLLDYGAVANTDRQYRQVRMEREKPKKRQKKMYYVHIPIVMPKTPELLTSLPSNILLYVQMDAGEVSRGKSISTALTTGLISAALTGGMYFVSTSTRSGALINVIVMDTEKNKVLWQNSFRTTSYKKYKVL